MCNVDDTIWIVNFYLFMQDCLRSMRQIEQFMKS